jgi:hypothetical protein
VKKALPFSSFPRSSAATCALQARPPIYSDSVAHTEAVEPARHLIEAVDITFD